jgi:endonuclease/exonuclease/phosphatase family metal-dependent hydrolase
MRLTLATLNIWGLPQSFSRHLNERMDAIATQLIELDADVVALQEVWLGAARERLLTPPLRERYPWICYEPGRFNSCALLTLSR